MYGVSSPCTFFFFGFCFFFFFVFPFVCLFFVFVHGRWFQSATHHPPVISTTVLRGVPTLRAHSAHSHRPGIHGLLEVPLHLLSSPAKFFQRRIRVKIHQVASLQSSLARSASLAACRAAAARSLSAARLRCGLHEM